MNKITYCAKPTGVCEIIKPQSEENVKTAKAEMIHNREKERNGPLLSAWADGWPLGGPQCNGQGNWLLGFFWQEPFKPRLYPLDPGSFFCSSALCLLSVTRSNGWSDQAIEKRVTFTLQWFFLEIRTWKVIKDRISKPSFSPACAIIRRYKIACFDNCTLQMRGKWLIMPTCGRLHSPLANYVHK